MSTESLIPDYPPMQYTESRTNRTVRFGHAATRAVAANIVALGRPARRIGPIQTTTYDATASSTEYNVSYSRSHEDMKQLWLRWTYRPQGVASAILSSISMELSITDGVTTISPTDSIIPVMFQGTPVQPVTAEALHNPFCGVGGEGYIDLDAVASILTGSDWTLKFVFRTDTNAPLDLIEAWECPRTLVSDSGTYGALTGPLNPGAPILAGSISTNNYARIAKTIEGGVKSNHTLLSVSWPMVDTIAPALISTIYAPFTRMLEGGTTPWSWRVRPRAVYNPNSSTGEPHRIRYYYRLDTSAGPPSAVIRCNTPSTTATSTVLTSTTAAWSDWVDINIPTDGTDRITTLQFTAKVDSSAFTLRLYSIQVEENQ